MPPRKGRGGGAEDALPVPRVTPQPQRAPRGTASPRSLPHLEPQELRGSPDPLGPLILGTPTLLGEARSPGPCGGS